MKTIKAVSILWFITGVCLAVILYRNATTTLATVRFEFYCEGEHSISPYDTDIVILKTEKTLYYTSYTQDTSTPLHYKLRDCDYSGIPDVKCENMENHIRKITYNSTVCLNRFKCNFEDKKHYDMTNMVFFISGSLSFAVSLILIGIAYRYVRIKRNRYTGYERVQTEPDIV